MRLTGRSSLGRGDGDACRGWKKRRRRRRVGVAWTRRRRRAGCEPATGLRKGRCMQKAEERPRPICLWRLVLWATHDRKAGRTEAFDVI